MKESRQHCAVLLLLVLVALSKGMCPLEQEILPCSCKTRASSVLISCRHATAKELKIILGVVAQRSSAVEEVLLAENFLPELSAEIFEASPQIHRLFLWNNGVQRIVNNTFGSLSLDVRELHVREPRLTDIPKDMLVSMVQLRKLTVEHTPLSILPELNFCQSLVEVYFDDTRISHLRSHSFFDLQDLRVIELKNSWISHFSYESLHNLPSLQAVNLTGNYISAVNASDWKYLPKLETLDLRGNAILETMSSFSFFETLKHLRTLHLDQNRIRIFDFKLMTLLPNLAQLTMTNNNITEVLNENFDKLSNIEELDLSSNNLKYLPEKLFRRTPALKMLQLNDNPLNASFELETVLTATKVKLLGLERCKLRELNLTRLQRYHFTEKISLRGNSLRSFPLHAIEGLVSLTELDLSRNNLSLFMDDLGNFFRTRRNFNSREESFWKFPALRAINLSENGIREIPTNFLELFPSIRSIVIQQNNLTEISGFENIKSLVYLDLSRNRLKRVKSEFCKELGKLETLKMNRNNLNDEISFKDCYNLRALDLSYNNIGRLPPSTFQSNGLLQMLNISFNFLSSVPNIQHLHHLTKLSLAKNKIETLHLNDLINNINLEIIDLSNNLINEIPPGYFVSKRLEKVDLSHNRVVSLAANTFSSFTSPCGLDLSFNKISRIENGFFMSLQRIISLNLSHNNLKSVDFREMTALTKIRVIDLNSNSIEDIRNLSVQNIPSLMELYLSNNSITIIHGSEFSNSRALMRVDISGNSITQLPLNAFSSLPHLEELTLANNMLRSIPPSVFNDLNSLDYLGLDNNFIESIDPNAFAGLCLVRYLNLSTNKMSHLDKTGISNLYSVEILDLSNNNIKELGRKTLRRLERLIYLNLDENNISQIAEDSLKYQSQLIKVSLRGNSLKSIPEKLLVPNDLRKINLKENPLLCNCGLLRLLEKLRKSRSVSAGERSFWRKGKFSDIDIDGDEVGNIESSNCQDLLVDASPSLCQEHFETLNEASLNLLLANNHSNIEDQSSYHTPVIEFAELTDIKSNVSTIYAKIQKNYTQINNTSSIAEEGNKLSSYVIPQLTHANETYQQPHSRLGLNLLPAVLNTGAWISRIINRLTTASRPSEVLPIHQIGSEILQSELYPGLSPGQILAIASNHFNLSLLTNLTSFNYSNNTEPQRNISSAEFHDLLPTSTTSRPSAKMVFPRYSPLAKTVKLLDYSSESAEISTLQANHEWNPLVSCNEYCKHSSNATQPGSVKERDSASNVTASTEQNERETLPVISLSGSADEEELLVADAHGNLQFETLSQHTVKNDTVTSASFEKISETFSQSQTQVNFFKEPPNFLKVSKVIINDSSIGNADETLERESVEIDGAVPSSFFKEDSKDEETVTGPSIPEFVRIGEVYRVASEQLLPMKRKGPADSRQDKTSPYGYQISASSFACKSFRSRLILISTFLIPFFCAYKF